MFRYLPQTPFPGGINVYSFLSTISESLTFKPFSAIFIYLGHHQKFNFQSWPQEETIPVAFHNTCFLTTSQHSFTWPLKKLPSLSLARNKPKDKHNTCENVSILKSQEYHFALWISASPVSASWRLSHSHLPAVCGISSALWELV